VFPVLFVVLASDGSQGFVVRFGGIETGGTASGLISLLGAGSPLSDQG
jgi:hypothetical protein